MEIHKEISVCFQKLQKLMSLIQHHYFLHFETWYLSFSQYKVVTSTICMGGIKDDRDSLFKERGNMRESVFFPCNNLVRVRRKRRNRIGQKREALMCERVWSEVEVTKL